jgi:hypothetical protein
MNKRIVVVGMLVIGLASSVFATNKPVQVKKVTVSQESTIVPEANMPAIFWNVVSNAAYDAGKWLATKYTELAPAPNNTFDGLTSRANNGFETISMPEKTLD